MTLEEKILHLRVAAMEEARAEENAIMKRHEDALRGVFEQHKLERKHQSELRIKSETVSTRQQLNMAVSKAQLEMKREAGKKHKLLKKALFAEVEEDVYKRQIDTFLLLVFRVFARVKAISFMPFLV